MITTGTIQLETRGNGDTIDITPEVVKRLAASKIRQGIAVVFVVGSTAAITTIENEPGLVSDFKTMWERVIPKNIPYAHDAAWAEANGYSHVRASVLGPSLTVPVNDGKPTLGTWQQIVLVDFDNRPRSRQIIVQFIGE